MQHFPYLTGQIREIYEIAFQVVPINIGALRIISRNLYATREALGIINIIGIAQEAKLLHSTCFQENFAFIILG